MCGVGAGCKMYGAECRLSGLGRRKLILWLAVNGMVKSEGKGGQGTTKVSAQDGSTMSPKMGPERPHDGP